MQPLLTAEEMREADRRAQSELGIADSLLMEHAALAIVETLGERFGKKLGEARGLVLAGPGNNGGDALAAARILIVGGAPNVDLFLPAKLTSPLAQQHQKTLQKLNAKFIPALNQIRFAQYDWAIDGLFGIGLTRAPEGELRRVIEALNDANKIFVVAADIPSGLNANTGVAYEPTVRASETVTFGFLKRGLKTAEAANYTGRIRIAPIEIPRSAGDHAGAFYFEAREDFYLPPRPPTSHKGTFGHAYLWAGPEEKQGAAGIAALAALRTGVGLVTVFGPAADLATLRARFPFEVMTENYAPDFFKKTTGTAALGPGMGKEPPAWDVVKAALASKWKLVVDADALNLISFCPGEAIPLLHSREVTVLTPHPKEAARLLGTSVDDIQSDRFAAARELSVRYKSTVLLKGKGTIIAQPEGPFIVVDAGTTALAKGGSGDLLTGILAAFLAQGLSPRDAAVSAAYVQGRAAERVSRQQGQERSALASEIALALPEVLAEWESWHR